MPRNPIGVRDRLEEQRLNSSRKARTSAAGEASGDAPERESDDRPSWRELDKRKDRSAHRGDDEGEFEEHDEDSPQRDFKTERYKKHLEELFSGQKRPNPLQQKELTKIRQARGDANINKACQEYVKKFNQPTDWESCMLFLDGTDAGVVKPALEQLGKLYPQQTPIRQTNLKQQLRIIQMTTRDIAVKQLAEKLSKQFA